MMQKKETLLSNLYVHVHSCENKIFQNFTSLPPLPMFAITCLTNYIDLLELLNNHDLHAPYAFF